MIKGGRILVLTLIAVLAVAVSASLQWGAQEGKAEITPDDITIFLKNSDVTLTGAQYASQTVDSTDCFEFDYIDGMRLTLAASFPSSLGGTFDDITVKRGGTVISAITKADVYILTVTVSYREGGNSKQTDKSVKITVNKLTLDIAFNLTERYYKDNISGAIAHYTAKPASVGTESLKYIYYEDESLTAPLPGAPEDAGEYFVKAYYEDSNNTNFQGEKVSSFAIHPSEAVIEAQSAEIKYSGSAINIANALNAEIAGICSAGFAAEVYTGGGYAIAETVNAAGSYRVRFHFGGGDANFDEPYSEEYDLVISKANIRFGIQSISVVWSGAAFDLSGELGSLIRIYNSDYETEIDLEYGAVSFLYFDASGNAIDDAPLAVGEYRVAVACEAAANYNAAQSDFIEYSIVKKDIVIGISGNYDASSGVLTAAYNVDGAEITYNLKDTDGGSLTENTESEIRYYTAVSEDNYRKLDGLPVMPGEYRVEIQAESEHYYGAKTLTLIIDKVTFTSGIGVRLNGVDFAPGGSFPYTASEVALEPYADESYEIDGFAVEFEGIESTVYPRSANKPRHAGSYRMYIALSDELFEGEISVSFTVTKLTVTVKPNDISAVYGDRLYIVGASLIYRAENVTVEGLAAGDSAASIVDYIRILIGSGDSTQTNATFTPGSYTLTTALKPGLPHSSYIIDVGGSGTGTLTVAKRPLTVSVNDITVAAGAAITPSVKDITGFAYSDASNNSIRNAIIFEFYEEGAPLMSTPNTVGRYSIKAAGTLDNYIINAVEGTLTICNPSIADLNALPFSSEGKFAPGETLKIEYGGITEGIKTAIGGKLPGYTAVRVYNVVDKAETADGSGLRVVFDISDLPESKSYKILAKYGTAYTEVDFTLNEASVVISEITMADAYILCDIHKIDYMWYIFGGAIILIIGVAVGVILRLYLTGGFKKKYKNESKAVIARANVKRNDDFDEIEQAIASFDESTVIREMTPAERLEQKRKEERYEQYRLKLQRLRSAGDKTFEDALIKSGIKNVNDDMIIEMMIAEDEERMRRIEEEARLEKEAQEREKDKPKAVILPKSTESYEQKSFAPKPKDEDDLDIDI